MGAKAALLAIIAVFFAISVSKAAVVAQDDCLKRSSGYTTLPVTGNPWQIGNPDWNTWVSDFAERFSTSKNGKYLRLTFEKRNVSLESGARFASSPKGVFPSEELTFRYQVYFKKGFNFVISGKLPGIYLGTYQEGYSTGKLYNYGQGSFRPTWQTGKGGPKVSPYLYGAHGDNEKARKAQGPKTSAAMEATSRAGVHFWMSESILPLKAGWNTIEIGLKMNTPGVADGKARVTVNGKTNILDDVSFRDTAETKIQSIAIECFFGGSSKAHMTPGYTQRVKFKNIQVRPVY